MKTINFRCTWCPRDFSLTLHDTEEVHKGEVVNYWIDEGESISCPVCRNPEAVEMQEDE